MHLHCFYHVPFEDAAQLAVWAREAGHRVSDSPLYAGAVPPALDEIDWLVVMGGPMNIYETDRYPWLAAEQAYIRAAISAGKRVLGVCLGAQLIADVLGGPVTRNPVKEIGWLPVSLTPDGLAAPLFAGFPPEFPAFHWHGDTFVLPPGAVHLAQSAGCASQAFSYRERVVGLQFHLESSADSIARLLTHCPDDITPGPYVQQPDAIRAGQSALPTLNRLLARLLENMAVD